MSGSEASFWDRMVGRSVSRRTLIKATAAAALGAAARAPLPRLLASPYERSTSNAPPRLRLERFTPIEPTRKDDLVLPREFDYRTLIRWKDPVNEIGDWFGYNCDFTAFLPLEGGERPRPGSGFGSGRRFREPGGRDVEGLYVVNHEYPDPTFIASVPDQQYSVGLSIVHLRRGRSGRWRVRRDSRYGRRYTAASPARLSGPGAGLGGRDSMVAGTLGNCSGAVTPWGTVLSCEEYTEDYGKPVEDGGFGWGTPYTKLEHYSWVAEIDPFDPEWVPVKRTALGRFHHENVALRFAPDGRLVAYMGDDAWNHFIYKYVSTESYDVGRGTANGDLLDAGQLYVAHCVEDGTGSWTPLPMTEDCLRDTHAYVVEKALAATPMDRPEDLELHPGDGSLYVALTHNTQPAPGRVIHPVDPDPYGKIARFIEAGGDPAAAAFRWEVFAVGGPEAGFAAPDNLEFDRAGNLWMASDFPARGEEYGTFGNNGLFMVPTSGEDAGIAFQFASAPVAAELAGPWISPDETTLFLAVQHPGETSTDAGEPTSRWPDGEGPPRPSCVAIRRRRGGTTL